MEEVVEVWNSDTGPRLVPLSEFGGGNSIHVRLTF